MFPSPEGPSLGLDQHVDARFRDEHMLAVRLQYYEAVPIQGDQSPPLWLRQSLSGRLQRGSSRLVHRLKGLRRFRRAVLRTVHPREEPPDLSRGRCPL